MPNLLPDWLPWIQPAGRLIWSTVMLIVGVAFVFVLMKPPLLKRPFPDRVGYALFLVIPVVAWIIAVILPDDAALFDWELDAIIVDLTLIVLVAHAFLMAASRKPEPAGKTASWAACYLGAVGTFALMALAYGVIPHEWLSYANGYLQWGETSKFVWQDGQWVSTSVGGLEITIPPFAFDYPALRDIVVSGIYVALIGLNVFLFVKWQDRKKVPDATPAEGTPVKRSRFGRPLRRSAAATPAGEGA
ncbi:MAG: hypothetical protein AMXMBFR46_19710 [Acidimicrobiia bacterium]